MTREHRRGFGSIRQERSGRYQARYTGPDGKRYTVGTFGVLRDAQNKLAKIQREIDLELWTSPDEKPEDVATFREVAEEWLSRRPKPLKPRTLAHYRRLLDLHILPTFGDVPVDQITRRAVESWYYGLDTEASVQRQHIYSLTRSIMARAVREHGVPGNPVDIEGASAGKRKITPVILTPAEINALAAAMPERLRPMILLAAWCALRFGELAALRRSDIDLDREMVVISRGVVRAAGQVIEDSPKTAAGKRDVSIPPHIVAAIRTHLDSAHMRRGRNALLFPAVEPDDHGNEKHLATSTLYKSFYRARVEIGRPTLRFHDLRHTGLTLTAVTGATIAELKARAGHSTADAAMIYQGVAQGRDAEIARALSAMVEK